MLNVLARPLKLINISIVIATMTFAMSACAEPLQSQDSTHSKPIALSSKASSNTAQVDAPENEGKVSLKIGETEISVEYADSPQARQLGLMYRREMCEDCGMLFKFSQRRIGSIWMKNTFIPLDLAYISEHGVIVDISPLQPHDLTPVKSSSEVLYALEMNLGWFAKQDIRVGDTVSLLP